MAKTTGNINTSADKPTEKKEKNPRRGNGEGSVIQRSEDLWAAVISYRNPVTNTNKRKTLYGKTRPEVLKKKKEWEKEYNETGVAPSRNS